MRLVLSGNPIVIDIIFDVNRYVTKRCQVNCFNNFFVVFNIMYGKNYRLKSLKKLSNLGGVIFYSSHFHQFFILYS